MYTRDKKNINQRDILLNYLIHPCNTKSLFSYPNREEQKKKKQPEM